MINITVSDQATISHLNQQATQMLKDYFSISNPLFTRKMDLGLSVWGIDASLKYYKIDDNGDFILPIGGLNEALHIISDQYDMSQIQIDDQRVEISDKDFFDLHKFTGTLRDYQQKMTDHLKEPTVGILEAKTGSGKTISFISHIFDKKVNTLILVNTLELVNQTKDAIEQFSTLAKSQIGTIGSGKFDIQPITIGLHQTMLRLPKDKIDLINKSFGQVIADECHVTAADLYYKTMTSLKMKYKFGFSVTGDAKIWIKLNNNIKHITLRDAFDLSNKSNNIIETRVLTKKGFTWLPVKSFLKHELGNKQLYDVYTAFGRKITITEDHAVLVYRDGEIVETRGDCLKLNDQLVVEHIIDSDIKLDYINSDDYLSHKFFIAGNYADWINTNSKNPKIKYTRKHGVHGPFITSEDYNEKTAKLAKKLYTTGANGNYLFPQVLVDDISYLLGFYIGDGSTDQTRLIFSIHKNELNSFKSKLNVLNKLGKFTTTYCLKSAGNSYDVRISGLLAEVFRNITKNQKVHDKRIPEIVWSFSLKNKKLFLQGLLDSDGHLQKRSRNRDRWVYTTISEGLATDIIQLLKFFNIAGSVTNKNPSSSTLKSGRIVKGQYKVFTVNFSKASLDQNESSKYFGQNKYKYYDTALVLGKVTQIDKALPEKYVYDISVNSTIYHNFIANDIVVHNSATPERADGLTRAIFWATGPLLYAVPKEDLKDSLIIPTLETVETNYYFPLFDSSDYTYMMTDLSEDKKRNEFIATDVKNKYNKDGYYVCVLCNQIAQVEKLSTLLGSNARHLTSQTKKTERLKIVEDLKNGKIRFIVSTYSLFATGIDVKQLNVLILAAPKKSKVLLKQSAGRIMRTAPGKTAAVIVDYVDNKIEMLRNQAKVRHKILTNL